MCVSPLVWYRYRWSQQQVQFRARTSGSCAGCWVYATFIARPWSWAR